MSEKITFKELVELIAKQSNQSESSANSFIHELVQIIEAGLERSGSVSISGFGKFELRWMKERPGINPQTGEEITIPGQNKVVFKPYKALRDEVNSPFANLKSRILGEVDDISSKDESEKKTNVSDNQDEDFEDIFGIEDESEEPAEPISAFKSVSTSYSSVDDLLIEHENPHYQSDTLTAAITEPEKKSEENSVAYTLPSESKVAEEVQKSGSFKWSYAAAVIIALLIFVILFFMIQRYQGDSSEQIADSNQTEQMITPATPDASESETEISGEPSESDAPEPNIPPAAEEQTEFETTVFTVEDGQSLWTIAETQLGNPYLWPVLYNLNSDLLDNPNQLPSASDIEIPSISDPQNLNSFEREQVALGYFSLYEWNRANNPEEARFFLWAVGVFSPDLLDQPPAEVDADDLEFARNR